jgi:hypothetical protein
MTIAASAKAMVELINSDLLDMVLLLCHFPALSTDCLPIKNSQCRDYNFRKNF